MDCKISLKALSVYPKDLEGVNNLIHSIKSKAAPGEMKDIYEDFAKTYDQEMDQIVWNAPAYGAIEVVTWLKQKDAKIFDVAAGTGLLGTILKSQGFTNIDALDASDSMLEEAKKTGAYTNLYSAFMGPNPLDILEDTYDAVVTVGSFAPGHLKEDCFEEIIRITKPGGYFILVLQERRLYEDPSYGTNIEPRMAVLEEQGLWKRLKRQVVPNYNNEHNGVVYILQIPPKF